MRRRFLRARQFNVEEAFKQFNNACTVRNANELLSAYDTFEVKDYEHCRQLVRDMSRLVKVCECADIISSVSKLVRPS